MNRRDFIKSLPALGAGLATLPAFLLKKLGAGSRRLDTQPSAQLKIYRKGHSTINTEILEVEPGVYEYRFGPFDKPKYKDVL